MAEAFFCEPLLDRFVVYSRAENGTQRAVCSTYTKGEGEALAALLNKDRDIINATLQDAQTNISKLLPSLDCDARDFAEYARGINAALDAIREMML